MSDYTPIDCGQYSEYELAILQRRRLRVSWTDRHGLSRIDLLSPVDLVTRDHAEYLVANRAGGDTVEVRLDRISHCEKL